MTDTDANTLVRHQDADGAWVYDDPTTAIAALDWLFFYGFNIARFDDYLSGEGWETPKAQAVRAKLLARRARALRAHNVGNDEATEAWLNFLQAAMQLHGQRDWLLGKARMGVKHSAVQARRRKGKPTVPNNDLSRNDRIKRTASRLEADGCHDANAQTAKQFNLSDRQIRRIRKG